MGRSQVAAPATLMTIRRSRKRRAKRGIFSPHSSDSSPVMPLETRYVLISPCRNEAAFMRQTLNSVVGQSLRPARWVIVDDGSTDGTPAILAEYASRHEWIWIVTRAERGRQ